MNNNNNPKTFNQKKLTLDITWKNPPNWGKKKHKENFFHFNKIRIQIIKSSLVSSSWKLINIYQCEVGIHNSKKQWIEKDQEEII